MYLVLFLITLVALLWLAYAHEALKERVAALERTARAQGVRPQAEPLTTPAPRLAPAQAQAPEVEWTWSLDYALRKNLFAVAGVMLLLLGFAFLFHSIEWGRLLPPAARIGLAWVAAGVLGVLGARLSVRNGLWGQVVQGGAGGLAYLATYVGAASYQRIPETVALSGFSAISAALVWRALAEDSKVLAAVGFLGAYAAPLLALHGHGTLAFNLGFGLIVTAAALWISHARRWVEVGIHAHVCAALIAAFSLSFDSNALSDMAQQAFLSAYLAVFLGWAMAWVRTYFTRSAKLPATASGREDRVIAACLATTVSLYWLAQAWLLNESAFAAVIVASSFVLTFLALRVFVSAGVLLFAAPAVLAIKSGADLMVIFSWVALGFAGLTNALAVARRRNAAYGERSMLDEDALAHITALTGILALASAELPERITTSTWLLAGVAFFACIATWLRASPQGGLSVRLVLSSAAGLVGGFVLLQGLADAPATAWAQAWASHLLPVLLACAGVGFVVASSKRMARDAWTAAAVVCALAMAKLLLALTGGMLSLAGSLLAMGVLFLLAGYLAPMPPRESR
jgi:uncharacterized membrane protein